MEKNKTILAAVAAIIVVVAVIAAIGLTGSGGDEKLKFGYVTWDGEISSTNVLALVLEEAGYDVDMVAVDAGPLYQGLSRGNLDFTTSAWMPVTHASYWTQYGDDLDVANVNLEGVKIGMAVPQYVYDAGVTNIADLNDYASQFGGRIVGIEPGAGVVMATERAIEDYDLKGYEIQTSSSAGMLASLKTAYANGEWIAVTLWSPHWAFEEWDMVYLEDPESSYGAEERVETLVRAGFAESNPGAYAIVSAFNWTQEDCQSVMLDIFSNGMGEKEAAQKWIDANRDRVDAWIAAGEAASNA